MNGAPGNLEQHPALGLTGAGRRARRAWNGLVRLALLLVLIAMAPLAQATQLYWRCYSGNTNWDTGFASWPNYWADGDTATFSTSEACWPNLGSNTVKVGSIIWSLPGYAYIYGGTINMSQYGYFWVESNAGLSVNSTLADGSVPTAVNLWTAGSGGVLVLAGANTYTGSTSIGTSTILVAQHGSALGNTSQITVNGLLSFQADGSNITAPISGSGAVWKEVSTGVTTLSGSLSYTGATVIGSGTITFTSAPSNTASLSIGSNGQALFSINYPFTFSKVISGAGKLRVDSSGTMTLTGTNTYTGPTEVRGKLYVNGDSSAATGTVDLLVSGAEFGGSGSLGGTVLVRSGASLNPGAQLGSAGTFSVGGVDMQSGAILNVQMGAKGVTGGTYNDLVAVSGNLTLDGTVNVALSSGGTFEPGKYPLFTYTGTLTDNTLAIGTAPAGVDPALLKIDTNTAGVVYLVYGGPNWDTATGNNAIDGGTGIWTASASSTNWTSDNGKTNGPWEQDKSATFAGSAGAVTVDNGAGAINFSALTFETSGYTFTGGTLTGTGTNNALKAGSGITATLGVTLAGANAFEKQDVGTISLSGANTYTGSTTISAGTLSVGAGGTSGSLDGTSGVAVASGATLQFNRSNAYAFAPVISGAGALVHAGSGTTSLSGANTYTGATTINAGTLSVGAGGASGSIDSSSGIAVASGATLQFNRSDAYTGSKVISGAGAVVQAGSGTTTLSGANTYTGSTTINAGTLLINGNQTSATGALSVASGATLGGTGTVGGAVSVQTGGIVAPGSGGAGTLTLRSGLTLNTGTVLNVELGQANTVGGSLNDLIAITGNLTLAGTVNITQTSGGTIGVGKYTLFTYTGTLTNNTLSIGTVPNGMSAAAMKIDTTTAGQVNLVISGTYWDAVNKNNGAVNGGAGTWTANATDSNWTSSGGTTNGPWAQDATATFAGTAGTVTVDNTSGAITYGGLTFNTTGYTVSGGTLTGTLSGSATSEVLIAASGVSATVSTILAGSAPVEKQGPGTLYLSGANTYTGQTLVTEGTLSLGANGATGSIAGSPSVAVASGATFQINRSDAYTFGLVVSGAGALGKAGSGTTSLTATHTYTGSTSVSAGTLSVGAGGTSGSLDGTSGVAVASGATLQFNRSNAYAFAPVISGAGALVHAGSGTTTLSGANTYTGATTINAGTLSVGAGGASGSIDSSSGIAVASGATLQFNRSDAYTGSKVISGAGAVVQAGSGTTTLSGANTYTGSTTINAGTLLINGNQTSATGALSVASGATLGGTGTVGGAVSVQTGGIVAPGSGGAGTLTLRSGLTLNTGTLLNVELGQANTVGGSLNDLIAITGNLTLAGTVNITQTSGGTIGVGKYTLFTYTGTLTNNTLSIGTVPNGMSAAAMKIDTTTAGQVNLVISGTYWDAVNKNNGAVNGGAGTWTAGVADSNWTGSNGASNGPWGQGGVAVFQGTGATVTVDNAAGEIDIGGLTFNVSGYTLSGGTLTGNSPTNVLTVGAGLGATVNTVLAGTTGFDKQGTGVVYLGGANTYGGSTTVTAGTLSIGNGGTTGDLTSTDITIAAGAYAQYYRSNAYTSAAVLSGAGGVIKNGAGTTTLTADSTYTGSTSINAGTLALGNGGTSGGIAGTSGVTIVSGATLQFNRSNAYAFAPVISGAGALVQAGSGTTSLSGANTYTGATTINAGTLSVGAGGASGSIDSSSGIAVASGATLQFNRSDAYTGSKVISGAGAVVQAGSGTTTLSAANTYTGSTTINAGTLKIGTANALNSTTAVTIASGAIFDINGSTASVGSVSGAGTLALGASGALTLTGTGSTPAAFTGQITGSGTITLNSGATLVLGAGISNANVNITLNGGTLVLASSSSTTHVFGTLRVVQTGGLDYGSGSTLTVATLTLDAGQSLTVTNWTSARSDKWYATAVTGSPVRDTGNLAPLNRITFSGSGYTAITTNWRSGTNEVTPIPAVPKVKIAKMSQGGVGTFAFSMTGLTATSDTLTTATAGVAVNGTSGITGTNGQAVVIVESGVPVGWPSNPASASCVDANGTVDGNGTGTFGTLASNTLTIAGTRLVPGADITCTFVNALNALTGRVFNDGGAPVSGVNTGVPNDGLQNGSEAGWSAIPIDLTDCSGTTLVSTATDGTGAWSLNIPTAQSGGTTCLVVGVPAGYRATGANVAGTSTPNGSATTVSGTAFTYDRAQQRLSFVAPSGGSIALNFGQVPESTLQYGSNRNAPAGGSAVFGHTFVAGTGGSVEISAGSATATPAIGGWAEAIYLDPGCTGKLQAGAAKLFPPTVAQNVVQGQTLCFVVQEFAPAGAMDGNQNSLPVHATLALANASPGLSASYTLTDVTTVASGALQLQKEVANITVGGTYGANNQAKPGETLSYRITYTNSGAAPLSNVVISDSTSAYTTFVSAAVGTAPTSLGTCTKNTPINPLPAAAVACSAAQSGSNAKGLIRWQFSGTLEPGASGQVTYTVTVD